MGAIRVLQLVGELLYNQIKCSRVLSEQRFWEVWQTGIVCAGWELVLQEEKVITHHYTHTHTTPLIVHNRYLHVE